jgi:PilZ domain-containing protein
MEYQTRPTTNGGWAVSSWTARETRREDRYPTNDEANVSVGPLHRDPQRCKILNVSRSGLQLELGARLKFHSRVQIAITGSASRGVAIFGEIRYCHRAGDVFHAGVGIHDAVFGGLLVSDHIDKDCLFLYAAGLALHFSEVLRIQRHLERCAPCIAALTEASGVLRRVEEQLQAQL